LSKGHVIPRGHVGPSLLAMILYAKFGEHQPLNRQSASYAREGIALDVSTLADHVGACTAALGPLHELIRRHVFGAERVHGDDTTVPLLAPGKTITARLWAYVRDDRPFAGPDPPAAVFFYSRNRRAEHPARHLAGYAGILQADAYAGFGDLYDGKRHAGAMGGATSSSWPICAKRRWRAKRSGASTRSSPSSAKSTPARWPSACRRARGASLRSSASWKNGCGGNAPACRATPRPPGQSITC
jgi:hypothetical protein